VIAADHDDGAGAVGLKKLLPSLVTLASVASASSAAMILVAAPRTAGRDVVIAVLLGVAMLCDRFDGWLARKLRATSETGAQLDSLADALAFGLLPVLWVVGRFTADLVVVAGAVAYVVCAVARLARSHAVGLQPGPFGPSFVGMPTPAAAALILVVIAADACVGGAAHAGVEAGALFVAAAAMVSPLRYPKRALGPGVLPFLVLVPLAEAALVVVARR
jgi:CDP-diacylglycerol--serine O-phosphatidyltransferase